MTQLKQIYKCNVCGNIVEVLHTGAGELVCCGQPMELKQEKTEEDGLEEKHVPVIEKIEGGFKVKVGEALHPMTEDHYIEWVELITEKDSQRTLLTPEMAPEIDFESSAETASARIYCNLHGLWQSVEEKKI